MCLRDAISKGKGDFLEPLDMHGIPFFSTCICRGMDKKSVAGDTPIVPVHAALKRKDYWAEIFCAWSVFVKTDRSDVMFVSVDGYMIASLIKDQCNIGK